MAFDSLQRGEVVAFRADRVDVHDWRQSLESRSLGLFNFDAYGLRRDFSLDRSYSAFMLRPRPLKLLSRNPHDLLVLDDHEVGSSLDRCLAGQFGRPMHGLQGGSDIWIFGLGQFLWRHAFSPHSSEVDAIPLLS